MKIERKALYRTADGKEHESREAAETHMLRSAIVTIVDALPEQVEAAVAGKNDALRNAFREVYLAMWPRQRKAKEPK